jgi:hypothetical protein
MRRALGDEVGFSSNEEVTLETISIELADAMTLGQLRKLARSMAKRLVISLESAGPIGGRRGARAQRASLPAPKAAKGRRRRRKLSPEARAALARNLEKARAARAAKLKAKTGPSKRTGKATAA